MAHIHLRHLNPFPSDLEEVLNRYDKVIVAENNLGQLCKMLRAEFLVPAESYNKVAGLPFKTAELEQLLIQHLEGVAS